MAKLLVKHKLSGFKNATMKIDIEGAEYTLIPYLIEQRLMCFFNQVLVEWHFDKFGITLEEHLKVENDLKQVVKKVIRWK